MRSVALSIKLHTEEIASLEEPYVPMKWRDCLKNAAMPTFFRWVWLIGYSIAYRPYRLPHKRQFNSVMTNSLHTPHSHQGRAARQTQHTRCC